MTKHIRFVVEVEVPDAYGPVTPDDLLSLCSLKHQGQLTEAYQIKVDGGTPVKKSPLAYRISWPERALAELARRQEAGLPPLTTPEISEFLGATTKQDREAVYDIMGRLYARRQVKRIKGNLGAWKYWV